MSAQPKDRYANDAASDDGVDVVHQALCRDVNEWISSVNHDFHVTEPETIDVVCECAHVNCIARIVMTVTEYEDVRRFPTRFFVKEGHEVAEGERVVTESAGYIVVEKRGRAGWYAVGADPRRRHLRSVGAGS
jgi:hypothetical protein